MLIVHRAERTDALAGVLAGVLAEPLTPSGGGQADPFAPEIVSVPARGVERWLQQHLARTLGTGSAGGHDGISANIDFPSPADLADRIVAAVNSGVPFSATGDGRTDDPWRPGRLVWPVLRVLDESLDDAAFRVIARHVGVQPAGPNRPDSTVDDAEYRRGRRYSTARQIADLFTRYATARPAMLAGWITGPVDGVDLDGTGAAVADGMAWQPGFFRAVHDEIGIAADRRREMCIAAQVKTKMAVVFGCVFGLSLRA